MIRQILDSIDVPLVIGWVLLGAVVVAVLLGRRRKTDKKPPSIFP